MKSTVYCDRGAFGTAVVRRLRQTSILLILCLGGCVTSFPISEYSIARAAYESARDAEAIRYAPSLWYNTEEVYREGEKAYRDRNFDLARDKFIQARTLGEQAENAARLARHQSGDVP